jgi:hypothetical protein
VSNSSTLRLDCQSELNKRIVIPRCDSACTFFFRRGVPSACTLHGLCAMSSNMMQYDLGMLRSSSDCTKLSTMWSNMIKYDLGMLLSCFDCTKLAAQNRKFALQTSGGGPEKSGGQSRALSDGNTNKLNRESQFLATCPTEAQTN